MNCKQCKWTDPDGVVRGGILVEDEVNPFVICGCCGGIMMMSDLNQDECEVETYDNWVDISYEIIGE